MRRRAQSAGLILLILFLAAPAHDECLPPETTQALFAAAHDLKKLVVIDASNPKYDGKNEEFFRTLKEGLNWIQLHL